MEHVTTLVSTQRVVAPSGAGDRTGPSTRPPAAAGSVEAAAQQPAWIWVLINWWCLFISWGHFICGVEQTNYVSPLVNYHTCSSEIRSSEGNQNRHHVSARVSWVLFRLKDACSQTSEEEDKQTRGNVDAAFDSDDQNLKLISVFDLENVHNVKVQIKQQ